MTRGAAGAEIEARSTSWRFDGDQDVTVPYAAIGEEAGDLILTGFGETDVVGIAERLAEYGVTGVAVASLTYPPGTKPPTPEVFEQSIVEGTTALVHDITGNGKPIRRAYGISGGGSQLILAAHHRPEIVGDIVTVAPGPLNPSALGGTRREQARELLGRFKEAGLSDTMKQQAETDWRQLMRELLGGLDYASTLDQAGVLAAVRDRLSIFVGDKDQVTPPLEYAAEGGIADTITLIPGMGHPTLLDEKSCGLVADIIRSTQTAAPQAEPAPV